MDIGWSYRTPSPPTPWRCLLQTAPKSPDVLEYPERSLLTDRSGSVAAFANTLSWLLSVNGHRESVDGLTRLIRSGHVAQRGVVLRVSRSEPAQHPQPLPSVMLYDIWHAWPSTLLE